MTDELDALRRELDDLRRRVEWLEDYVVSGFISDAKIDRRRLTWDCDRRKAPVTEAVVARYTRRTNQRTERSPTFDGGNFEALRQWAGQRAALPAENGGLRLIFQGSDGGIVRRGDRLAIDPDTSRVYIDRDRDRDHADLDEFADLYHNEVTR